MNVPKFAGNATHIKISFRLFKIPFHDQKCKKKLLSPSMSSCAKLISNITRYESFYCAMDILYLDYIDWVYKELTLCVIYKFQTLNIDKFVLNLGQQWKSELYLTILLLAWLPEAERLNTLHSQTQYHIWIMLHVYKLYVYVFF